MFLFNITALFANKASISSNNIGSVEYCIVETSPSLLIVNKTGRGVEQSRVGNVVDTTETTMHICVCVFFIRTTMNSRVIMFVLSRNTGPEFTIGSLF